MPSDDDGNNTTGNDGGVCRYCGSRKVSKLTGRCMSCSGEDGD